MFFCKNSLPPKPSCYDTENFKRDSPKKNSRALSRKYNFQQKHDLLPPKKPPQPPQSLPKTSLPKALWIRSKFICLGVTLSTFDTSCGSSDGADGARTSSCSETAVKALKSTGRGLVLVRWAGLTQESWDGKCRGKPKETEGKPKENWGKPLEVNEKHLKNHLLVGINEGTSSAKQFKGRIAFSVTASLRGLQASAKPLRLLHHQKNILSNTPRSDKRVPFWRL